MKWFKNKRFPLFIGCFVLVASFFLCYKPIYIAIYRWKEPHFIMPVYLKDNTFVLRNDKWGKGHFGAERKNGRLHRGIDIRADEGTVVYAAKSGRAFCSYEPEGMGKYIKIVHPDGFSTVYGHLKDWSIEERSRVKQGQIIGFVGKSGNANIRAIQPHLHFEIRNAKEAVNPVRYLQSNGVNPTDMIK